MVKGIKRRIENENFTKWNNEDPNSFFPSILVVKGIKRITENENSTKWNNGGPKLVFPSILVVKGIKRITEKENFTKWNNKDPNLFFPSILVVKGIKRITEKENSTEWNNGGPKLVIPSILVVKGIKRITENENFTEWNNGGPQTSFSINFGGKLRFNKISLLCGWYHWKRVTLVCCKVKPGVQGEVHWSRFQAITVIRNQSVVFSVTGSRLVCGIHLIYTSIYLDKPFSIGPKNTTKRTTTYPS